MLGASVAPALTFVVWLYMCSLGNIGHCMCLQMDPYDYERLLFVYNHTCKGAGSKDVEKVSDLPTLIVSSVICQQMINPAPGACFIPKFISLGQVVPGPV